MATNRELRSLLVQTLEKAHLHLAYSKKTAIEALQVWSLNSEASCFFLPCMEVQLRFLTSFKVSTKQHYTAGASKVKVKNAELDYCLLNFSLLPKKSSRQRRQENYCENYDCDTYLVGDVHVDVEERQNSNQHQP
jgi:hypothetical protein